MPISPVFAATATTGTVRVREFAPWPAARDCTSLDLVTRAYATMARRQTTSSPINHRLTSLAKRIDSGMSSFLVSWVVVVIIIIGVRKRVVLCSADHGDRSYSSLTYSGLFSRSWAACR